MQLNASMNNTVSERFNVAGALVVGLGGRANGYPRETGFDITAASEVMAILAVARDIHDLRRRVHRLLETQPST